MLAEFVDKIVSMKETKLFEIEGQQFSDRELHYVRPHVNLPEAVRVNGLDSICKLIRTEQAQNGTVFVNVEKYDSVEVITSYQPDLSRNMLYHARADVPGFNGGWRDRETALVQLRSLFIPGEGTEYLLDILSRISEESKITSSDNGITQVVEAREGISLNAFVAVRPRVTLQPFRTFLEVPQPESEFLIRVDKDRGIGFFEADGGVWKLEAKRNVAKYFNENLKDLIDEGKVVVML